MAVQEEINIWETSTNLNPNSASLVIVCMRTTFVKKNSFLIDRIVSFDTVGHHLLTFHILEPYPSKDNIT